MTEARDNGMVPHPDEPVNPPASEHSLNSEPSAKPQRSEKGRPSIFWVLAALIIPLGSLLARFRITDGGKLPRHGAYIISPNHYSEIDPVMVGMVVWKLGRLPRFLAKESLFRIPVAGWFLRKSGQVPVARGGSARGAAPLAEAQKIVDDGKVVII